MILLIKSILLLGFIRVVTLRREKDLIRARGLGEYAAQSGAPEVTKHCPLPEMAAYGLTADAYSLSEPNYVCPRVRDNCCGREDQERIMAFWKKDRKIQEAHHRFVLKTFRYILGFGDQYKEIAKLIFQLYEEKLRIKSAGPQKRTRRKGGVNEREEASSFTVKATPFCVAAAKTVLESGFWQREKAEYFYADLNAKVQFLDNSRRGFYCLLCSAGAKNHIGSYWTLLDFSTLDRIYYDPNFCRRLFDVTFETVYTTWKSFQPFVAGVLRVLTCINANHGAERQVGFNVNGADPVSRMPPELKALLKHPLGRQSIFKLDMCSGAHSDDFWFLGRCRWFCAKWNIARPSVLFDGDFEAMKRLFDFLSGFEQFLSAPSQNLFRDDVTMLKKTIIDIYEERLPFSYFYQSISTAINFAHYRSEFLSWVSGLDPYWLAEHSKLVFDYRSAGRMAMRLFLFFLVILELR